MSKIKKTLLEKIDSKDASIGVFGLGYVGLPLALLFEEGGFQVVGFDIDSKKVDTLNEGRSYIKHILNEGVARASSRRFEATTDFSRSAEIDALLICVPTPLDKYLQPDLSFVLNTIESTIPHLREGQIVALESTTYPGTTEEEMLPRLESSGLKVGQDIFLVYSPEREDPANPDFTTRTIPKICGGVTPDCQEIGIALYESVIDRVVPLSSPRAAEMTKLLENIHRAVNIGLVNEMKMVADKMGIDIYEVIDAAATKPFGFVPYYPGPGLGGHCIPIDPFYLTWKAREYGVNTRFIELAGEINRDMPNWVISKLTDALNAKGITINGAKIMILGVAYKRDVDDMRESPALKLLEILRAKGAELFYHDPYVPKIPLIRDHTFNLTSCLLTPESLSKVDCILLVTDHSNLDYELVLEHADLIVDTRGVFKEKNQKVIKA